MIDLRRTLSQYGIEWRDRGKNCSKGWLNINCPFCRDDPSYHLRLSEQLTGYYCLRNTKHRGGGLHYVFATLKIPTKGLPEMSEMGPAPVREPKDLDTHLWPGFQSAAQSTEMLSYLSSRKFLLPKEVVSKFDLRFSPAGSWAGRLLIPLTQGWTGRSVREWIEPRYLSEANESSFFMYGKGQTAIIVEGPMDALKLAAVTSQFIIIAMTGGRISPSLICTLKDKNIRRVYCAPDSDAPLMVRIQHLQELRTYCHNIVITDAKIEGFKDCGEMNEFEAREWVYRLPQ